MASRKQNLSPLVVAAGAAAQAAPAPAAAQASGREPSRRLINAFIVLHLAMIVVWCLPDDFALRSPLARTYSRYIIPIGLWQGWDMFSPNPRSANIRVTAQVRFEDGSWEDYDFPQMDRLNYWDRYRRERFRKWANDHMRLDKNTGLWKPAAHWVARQFAHRPLRVTRVRLHRSWWDIPAPKAGGWLGRIAPPKAEEKTFLFYDHSLEDVPTAAHPLGPRAEARP